MRRWVVPLVAVSMLVLGVGVPSQAQAATVAELRLVHAVPDVVVDVLVDSVLVVEGAQFGDVVANPGDLAYEQTITVEVREAGTTTVLVAPTEVTVPRARSSLAIHYDATSGPTVSLFEDELQFLCDPIERRQQQLRQGGVDFRHAAAAPEVAVESRGSRGGYSFFLGNAESDTQQFEAGTYELTVGESLPGSTLLDPQTFDYPPGFARTIYLVGSVDLDNLQYLTFTYEPVASGPCPLPQQDPLPVRPAGQVPDVEVLLAIPRPPVDVLVDGVVVIEGLAFDGQSVNDDTFGGFAPGQVATVQVRDSRTGAAVVEATPVTIEGQAGTLVIHRTLSLDVPDAVTYYIDPVDGTCPGEGDLRLRNTSALALVTWGVGTGPYEQEEDIVRFDVGIVTTPPIPGGAEFAIDLSAGDYLTRTVNWVNGEPTGRVTALTVGAGEVTTEYLVGGARDPNFRSLVTGYRVREAVCPEGPRPVGELPDVGILLGIWRYAVDVYLDGELAIAGLHYNGQAVNDDELGGFIPGQTLTVEARDALTDEVVVPPTQVTITGDAGTVMLHRGISAGGHRATATYFPDPVEPLCEADTGFVFRHAAARDPVRFTVGTGEIGGPGSGPPVLEDELYTSPALAVGEQDQRALVIGDYLVRMDDDADPQGGQFAEVSGSSGQVTVLALVSDDRDQDTLWQFLLTTTYDVVTTTCAAPAPSPTPAPTPSPTPAPVPKSVPTGASPPADSVPRR